MRVEFTNSQGKKLIADLEDVSKYFVVIIAPGFTSYRNNPRFVKMSEALSKEGISSFRLDFGGYGESEEQEISVKNQCDDLESSINLLKEKGFRKIGILGASLGGLTALTVNNFDAIALWGPVTKSRTNFQFEDKGDYYIFKRDNQIYKLAKYYKYERANVDKNLLKK